MALAALSSACGLVLGLDGVRNCSGAECGDAAAEADAAVGPDAAIDQGAGPPDAGAWTPDAFGSDLALWLATDYGVTAPNGIVSAWTDRAHGAVAIGSTQNPTLDKGVAGTEDAIHFTHPDGVLVLPDSPYLQIGTSDMFLIEVVARVNALDDSSVHFFAKVDTAGTTFGKGVRLFAGFPGAAGQLSAYMSDGATSYDIPSANDPFKDGAFHMLGIRRTSVTGGSTTHYNIDATEFPAGALNALVDISAPGIQASIGRVHPDGLTSTWCDFSVAEIVVVRRTSAITQLELAHLWVYLKAKYGI